MHKKHLVGLLASLPVFTALADERLFLNTLCASIDVPTEVRQELYALARTQPPSQRNVAYQKDLVLCTYFPDLAGKIPYVPLGSFPTPVYRLSRMSEQLGTDLYVKCDNLSGKEQPDGTRAYGGNKVRKLELLLGQALNHDARSVVTFGCAGSNHATATAWYARQLGLRSYSLLLPQLNSRTVRKNLLLMGLCQSNIRYGLQGNERVLNTIACYKECKQNHGEYPYFIPTGGSTPLGTLGFVNAACEVHQQIEQGMLPEPDYLYLACGTVGTAAGLLLGIKALGLKTKIIAVNVEGGSGAAKKERIFERASQANALLRTMSASFPLVEFSSDDVEVISDFSGGRYGLHTKEGSQAIELVHEQECVVLEGTYTGKACAALVAHARAKKLTGKTVLFWNTYSGESHDALGTLDYSVLPEAVHTYFTTSTQEETYE